MPKTRKEEFESPLPHSWNPLQQRVSFLKSVNGDTMGTQFKKATLNVSGPKWYVEYWYKVPVDLQPIHKKKWKRFKVYWDINRVKTAEYAEGLLQRVNMMLELGYNPFESEKKKLDLLKNSVQVTSIQQAIDYFKSSWNRRGLQKSSIRKYERTADRLSAYLRNLGLDHHEPDILNRGLIERYLTDSSGDWSNRTYNNEKKFLSTIFRFLIKEGIIERNPADNIDLKKTTPSKHRYYDDRLFDKVKQVLEVHDPYLLFAMRCVYYLCIRSEKELKYLQVKNIFPDRKQVLITSGKTGERYIPLPDAMLEVFKERGVLDAPSEYYVFGVPHKNKFTPDGKPGPTPFGNGFFSKRFSKLRKKIGIDQDYTIYGMKHTRVVHLKIDGVSDADIMSLTGHSDFASYSKYLKDLGLTSNPESLNAKTRRI